MPPAPLAYYVIGDEDTVLGFRYAGVSGEVVTNTEEARQAFSRAAAERRDRILVLTDVIAETIRGEVNAVRAAAAWPLVVEVPGPTGPMAGKQTLLELIQEAVGVRI
jgi:V/A-type H+-transporting ATPase subunit F